MSTKIFSTAASVVLSAIFAALTIAPPALAASEIRDPQGDWVTGTNPDFDIRKAAVNEDRNPFIEVYGTAGGTMASGTGVVYAYYIITGSHLSNEGKTIREGYAVTSHDFADDPNEPSSDGTWHAHYVELDTSNNCITSITEAGSALLHNGRATVREVTVEKVVTAVTAELQASPTGACVTAMFDSAP